MIYFKIFLISIWMFISCVVGLLLCIPRWGDTNMDAIFGRIFAWGARRASGIKVVIEGEEHLTAHQPCVYIANHQSGLDMAIFGGMYPRGTVLTGKKEIIYVPFFGLFFVAAGNIRIDRNNRRKALQSLEAAGHQIKKEKKSVWIFPEGTRNREGRGLLPFKKGPFYLAISAQIPIVPVVTSPLAEIVNWKNRKFPGGTVRVRILPPISTVGKTQADVEALLTESRNAMLKVADSYASEKIERELTIT